MQENRTKQHRRKMVAPILISAAVVLYYLFFFLYFIAKVQRNTQKTKETGLFFPLFVDFFVSLYAIKRINN